MDSGIVHQLAFETALTQYLILLHYQNNTMAYQTASVEPEDYLARFPDTIPVRAGGELRALLLLCQAAAVYYTASERTD